MATVLVVDDDPDILEVLSEILESEGFNVRRAKHGLEALSYVEVQEGRPELILLDLMMPIMDGQEFAQKLKLLLSKEEKKIPFIVSSADRSISTKAKAMGAVGYLAKPFELQELLKMVGESVHPCGCCSQSLPLEATLHP